uniref:Uncharacterized protein n=1 Tax=viral metagenome TaxID=1070528 RepID=A0A6M3L0H5_9ZZZZ
MKVICKNCGKPVPEDDAIRMSVADFKLWTGHKNEADIVSIFLDEHNIYTQICEECL